ncbi:MAG: J domain-containing protein [Gammaproteobacteria bacterium]|nr:J domain-containing protein [Gammaproteobacteria bacterium]
MAAPNENPDYYEVLHVSREAPLEIIRSSYRTLMQKLKNHPDLGGDAATAAMINEAYSVLTDEGRRAEYDARLDILAGLANGVPDEPTEQPVDPEPAKVLNPYVECVFCEAPHGHGKFIEIDFTCDTCSSPLAAAENKRLESVSQRAVARINKAQTIIFYTHWPQTQGIAGQTEDISLNGLRFVTQHELIEGQRIKIVSNVLDAVANVTHCIYQRHGWKTMCIAGVSFSTLRFARSVGGFVSRHV